MRTWLITGAVMVVPLLGACSEADQRTVLMAAAARACAANLDTQRQEQQSPFVPGEIDSLRLCTCLVDRVADGKTLAELRDIVTGGGPLPDARALTQCAMEEGRRSGILPGQS
jgi:hypothetical protein